MAKSRSSVTRYPSLVREFNDSESFPPTVIAVIQSWWLNILLTSYTQDNYKNFFWRGKDKGMSLPLFSLLTFPSYFLHLLKWILSLKESSEKFTEPCLHFENIFTWILLLCHWHSWSHRRKSVNIFKMRSKLRILPYVAAATVIILLLCPSLESFVSILGRTVIICWFSWQLSAWIAKLIIVPQLQQVSRKGKAVFVTGNLILSLFLMTKLFNRMRYRIWSSDCIVIEFNRFHNFCRLLRSEWGRCFKIEEEC